MDLTQTHARFEDTSHTLIAQLHDPEQCRQAIEKISRIYWKPVYSYLRHNGKNRDQASELTQAFFVQRVIENELFERFDSGRGKLRSFLIISLKRFLIDLHRESTSYGKSTPLSMDQIGYENEDHRHIDAVDIFDQTWAIAQLEEALRRCEIHLRETSRLKHWEAFQDRIYGPSVNGSTPTLLKQLSVRLGFNKPADVASAVQLVNQKVHSYLREVISEAAESGSDANEEYLHMLNILNIQTVKI